MTIILIYGIISIVKEVKNIRKLSILIIVILLCGCEIDSSGSAVYNKYIDKDTCIIYLSRYEGGITPMYNQDGTLKVDNKCLESKGEE